ncbi:siderophore-iron reductase FhuF, partial [Pseudomonas syringae pv. tagetis]
RVTEQGVVWRASPVVPFQRFGGLLDHMLEPFIAALSAYGGLADRVLWVCAGDYVDKGLVLLAGWCGVRVATGVGGFWGCC